MDSLPCFSVADESDLDAILRVEQQSLIPYSAEILRQILQNSNVFKCEIGGSLVGYGVADVVFEDGEIINLVVDKAARGQGIGAKLLDLLLKDCLARKAKRVLLEVAESNFSAIHLYKRFGFAQISVRKNYYQNQSALIFQLDLQSL